MENSLCDAASSQFRNRPHRRGAFRFNREHAVERTDTAPEYGESDCDLARVQNAAMVKPLSRWTLAIFFRPRNTVPGSQEPILPRRSVHWLRSRGQAGGSPNIPRTVAVVIGRIGQRWRWMGSELLSCLCWFSLLRHETFRQVRDRLQRQSAAAVSPRCRLDVSPASAKILLPGGTVISASDAVLLWTEGSPPPVSQSRQPATVIEQCCWMVCMDSIKIARRRWRRQIASVTRNDSVPRTCSVLVAHLGNVVPSMKR